MLLASGLGYLLAARSLAPVEAMRGRAGEITLERERAMQAELAKLQPPPNYKGPYSQFLSNRQLALTALERLQKAAKKKNREEYVVAAGDFALRTRLVDHYAPAAGTPSCTF